MALLNDWEGEKIVSKDRILEFEFLRRKEYIEEIEDGYFYLTAPFSTVEKEFYDEKNRQLMKELKIENIDLELKALIKKFNDYNEIKDVAEMLCAKIADLRGVSMKDVHAELGILPDE